jgi:hypothetical protein
MDTLDTSTAAVALTVKPSVDPKVAIAIAAVALTAVGAVAYLKYRKSKKVDDSTDAAE